MTSDPTPLVIEAGERSPRILFDPGKGTLQISGESYPEDAAAFFGPVLRALENQLLQDGPPLLVELELAYFSSSSAKAMMNVFQMLQKAASQGRDITVNWRSHRENDRMCEFD